MALSKKQLIIFLVITLISFALRFWHLSINPPGLYWDEAAFGYDAYSILKTGHDQYGQFMPLFFQSFGDWKLPGYFYLLVPSIKVFGLSELAVRFPSALLGSLTPIIFFLLARQITKNTNLSLTSMFFLAISPWHIQFSRGGFETTVGLFFVLCATYLYLIALETKKVLIFTISYILFALSIYTYHSYRIFTPLLVISIIAFNFRSFKKSLKSQIIPLILVAVMLVPMLIFSLSPNGLIRATSQTAFKKNQWEEARRDYDQKSKKPLRVLSKYFDQHVYYGQIALKAYLDHFSPIFLFLKGDQTGRHSQVDMGQIYSFDAFFLAFSLFSFKKIKGKGAKMMLAWLLLAPLPATIVTPTPHADRAFQMVIPLTFFSAFGVYSFFSLKGRVLFKSIIIFFVVFSFLSYIHLLFIHYPKKFAADWQDGYKQMVQEVKKYEGDYNSVYITTSNQLPYIYLLFYGAYDPAKYIASGGTKDMFGKYIFVPPDYNIYNKGKILYVGPAWQKQDGLQLSTVNDSSGKHIFSVWEMGGSH